MKSIKMLFAITLLSIIGVSCDTEPTDPVLTEQNPDDNNPGGGGGNNNGGDGTYWPLAVENTWFYNITNGTDQDMTIGATQTIDGETYYKFDEFFGSNGPAFATGDAYARVDNGSYYVRVSATTNTGMSISGLNYIIFKDYLNVGETWTDTFTQSMTFDMPGMPEIPDMQYEGTILGKILEKDISIEVEGETFNHVIHARVTQSVMGAETVSDYWWAKDVGPVKIILTASDGGDDVIETLASYDVN